MLLYSVSLCFLTANSVSQNFYCNMVINRQDPEMLLICCQVMFSDVSEGLNLQHQDHNYVDTGQDLT